MNLLRDWIDTALEKDGDAYMENAKRFILFQQPTNLFSHATEKHTIQGKEEEEGREGDLLASVLFPIARVLSMGLRDLRLAVGRDPDYFVSTPAGDGCWAWLEQQAIKRVRNFLLSRQHQQSLLLWQAAPSYSVGRMMQLLEAHMAARIRPTGRRALSDPPVPSQLAEQHPFGSAVSILCPADAEGGCRAAGSSEGSIVLAEPLPPFSQLMRVPRSELFNIVTAREFCPLARYILSQLAASVPDEETVLLLSFTFQHFGIGWQDSHWKALLQRIPHNFDNCPTFWGIGDIAELDGTELLDEVLAKRDKLAEFTSQVGQLVAHFPPSFSFSVMCPWEEIFSEDHLNFSRAVFDSRAFHLGYGEGRILMTLAPGADMLNHSTRTDVLTRYIDPASGDFVLETGAELLEGDVGRELWMTYGPLQNWELLLSYGFVLQDNENDVLPLPLSFDLEAAAATEEEEEEEMAVDYARRRKAVIEQFFLPSGADCAIPRSGRAPPSLLALVRLFTAEAEDFASVEKNPFACLANGAEHAVTAAVASAVEAVLEAFPSTLEDDVAELDSLGIEDAPENEKRRNYLNAMMLRISLKQIAARALGKCHV